MMAAKESKIGFVVAGLLLGILMAAMDNTIVATAMATIVSDLGGFDMFIWVTSAYMVAMMAGTPIFGKLSDMYGRKRFFVFGLGAFLLGSILCGTASSMTELAIYRAIQGLGGGALMPIAFTIMFDLFPPEKRGKMGGLFGAVFGLSSILGPLMGAYITEYLEWRWVFYINLPLGVLSVLFVSVFYRESLTHTKQKIDWLGAFTLVAAVVSLMFALELGGNEYAWDSAVILGLFAAFAVMFAGFIYAESKAADPIISFAMFRKRLFATSNGAALLIGAAFIVATVYIPMYVQGVLGGSATNAGFILTPMMLGSVAGSQLGGFLTTRTSYRNIMLGASVFFLLGLFLLSTLTPETTRAMVTLFMIVTGFGTGFSFSVLSMSAIHEVDMRQRGSATSTNRFMTSLGITLGVTIFGIVQRNAFASGLAEAFGQAGGGGGSGGGVGAGGAGGFAGDARSLLTPEGRARIPKEALDRITDALSSSIAGTFLWALIPAALAACCILLMPNVRMALRSHEAPRQQGHQAGHGQGPSGTGGAGQPGRMAEPGGAGTP